MVQEEAAVPNLTELVAVANDINYNIKQSLVLVEEMEGADIVFSLCSFKTEFFFQKVAS